MPSTPETDQQKFAALIDRVFTDPQFAKSMESDPAKSLSAAGFTLTPAQIDGMKKSVALPSENELVDALPWTRPVVTILTKGTQPVVQVAVSVVTGTVVTLTPPATSVEKTEPPKS